MDRGFLVFRNASPCSGVKPVALVGGPGWEVQVGGTALDHRAGSVVNVVDLQSNRPQVNVYLGEKTHGTGWCCSAWIRLSSVGGGAERGAPPPMIVAKGLAWSRET